MENSPHFRPARGARFSVQARLKSRNAPTTTPHSPNPPGRQLTSALKAETIEDKNVF